MDKTKINPVIKRDVSAGVAKDSNAGAVRTGPVRHKIEVRGTSVTKGRTASLVVRDENKEINDKIIDALKDKAAKVRNKSALAGSWIKSKDLSDLLDDKILTIQTIESGLPYKSFETICEQSPFTQAFWAEALGLSPKSLNRYKQAGKKFKPLQSEKIIELAEVSNLGRKVFDNDEDFELWLNAPNLALGNNKPIYLIKNSYGKELVITELTNIEQGIFV